MSTKKWSTWKLLTLSDGLGEKRGKPALQGGIKKEKLSKPERRKNRLDCWCQKSLRKTALRGWGPGLGKQQQCPLRCTKVKNNSLREKTIFQVVKGREHPSVMVKRGVREVKKKQQRGRGRHRRAHNRE